MDATPILQNPYVVTDTLSLIEMQLLLFGALVCFVTGLLLAEAHTLRRILIALDRSLWLDYTEVHTLPLQRSARQLP